MVSKAQSRGIKQEQGVCRLGLIDMLKGRAAECSTVINEFQTRRLGNIEYMISFSSRIHQATQPDSLVGRREVA